MEAIRNIPYVVYQNVHNMIRFRNGQIATKSEMSEDEFEHAMKVDEYVFLDCEFQNVQSGQKTSHVYYYILSSDSKYKETKNIKTLLVRKTPTVDTDIVVISKSHERVTKKTATQGSAVVADDKISAHLKNAVYSVVDTFKKLNVAVEIITYDYQPFMNHIPNLYQPMTFCIADNDEINEFFSLHHENKSSLPRIDRLDPVAVWLGGKPGDIIKINRISETAGFNVVYRRVI